MASPDFTPASWDAVLAPPPAANPSVERQRDQVVADQGVPFNRGSAIAQELKTRPAFTPTSWDSIFPGAGPAPKPAAPDTGLAVSDFPKSLAAGAISGAGAIPQGAGELIARGINKVGESFGFDPQARAINPMQGWINDLLDSRTPAAKKAEADTQISGNILEGPSGWSFGKDPSITGVTLQGLNAVGQFMPNFAAAMVTLGASIPAQFAVGAAVGGLQAFGSASEEERAAVLKMSHADLMKGSTLYAEMIGKGIPERQAQAAVAEAAALWGGAGNALPSAFEGLNSVLIAAITKGKLPVIPMFGKGAAGRMATGTVGGGLMGGTEEAYEQAGQNVGSNIAIGGNRPVGQDTLQNFIMGALGEGTAGAGVGAASKTPATAEPAPVIPPAADPNVRRGTIDQQQQQEPPVTAQVTPQVAPLAPSPIDQARADLESLNSGTFLPPDRQKNAVLLATYGENAAVRHVIEGADQFAALGDAMLAAAPAVEQARQAIGGKLPSVDITTEIVGAIGELERMKAEGKTIADVMATGIAHDISHEGQQLMAFLHENAGNPDRMAAFIRQYLQAIEDIGGLPNEERNRGHDIAREMDKRHADKLAQEEKAREQKAKQDEKAARTKEADRAKAAAQAQDQNVETAIAVAKAAGSGINPNHLTAIELAFQNAGKLKEKKNASKPSAAGNAAVPAAKAASPEARPRPVQGSSGNDKGPVPKLGPADNGDNARPASAAGGGAGAQDSVQAVNRGSEIAAQLKKAPKKKSQTPAQGGSAFLQAVKRAGGIHPKAAGDISGDTAVMLNRRLPGLMSNQGRSSDALVEWAQQEGYITEAQADDAEKNLPGGAHELVHDLIRRAVKGEDIHKLGNEDEQYRAEADARAAIEEESAPDAWATMTNEEKDNELDDIFGKESRPAQDPAAGAQGNAPIAASEVGQAGHAETGTVTLSATDIPADLKITLPVLVEDVGETVYVEQNARQAFKSANRKVNRLKSLLDCLRA